MNIDKRVVAREWLILFSSLILGFATILILFFHSYDFTTQDLTWEQKLGLLTREQLIMMAKEKGQQERHDDSLKIATGFDPDAYLRKKGHEAFLRRLESDRLDEFMRRMGVKLGGVSAWEQFVDHLFSWRYFFETWASVVSVFIVVQILRSLYWALRVLTRKE